MTTPTKSNTGSTWRWAMGIVMSILVTAGAAGAGIVATQLQNHETRIDTLETDVAVGKNDLSYIRDAVREIRDLIKVAIKETP